MPVLPNTEHPLSRRPLAPFQPLPWSHVYHYTCHPHINIRVRNRCVSPSTAIKLGVRETLRLEDFWEQDLRRAMQLRRAYISANPEAAPVDTQSIPSSRSASVEGPISDLAFTAPPGANPPTSAFDTTPARATSNPRAISPASSFDGAVADSLVQSQLEILEAPICNSSYKYSTVDALTDPKEWFLEIQAIKQYVHAMPQVWVSCCSNTVGSLG